MAAVLFPAAADLEAQSVEVYGPFHPDFNNLWDTPSNPQQADSPALLAMTRIRALMNSHVFTSISLFSIPSDDCVGKATTMALTCLDTSLHLGLPHPDPLLIAISHLPGPSTSCDNAAIYEEWIPPFDGENIDYGTHTSDCLDITSSAIPSNAPGDVRSTSSPTSAFRSRKAPHLPTSRLPARGIGRAVHVANDGSLGTLRVRADGTMDSPAKSHE